MKGSLFSTHKSRRDSNPFCKHKGCETRVNTGREYCRDHGYFCPCGKSISRASKHCSSCASKLANANLTEEQREARSRLFSAAQKTSPRGNINELKEIIRSYEDAWLRGYYPDLAQMRLPVLRAQLKQMETENVRSNRKEVTHASPDCS